MNADYVQRLNLDLDQLKKEFPQIKSLAQTEDEKFVALFDAVYAGKTWKLEELLNHIKCNHGLTRVQYDLLFNTYNRERAEGKDVAESGALAVLLMCHEYFIFRISKKILLPPTHSRDEMFMRLEMGLRKAVDSFDPRKGIYFLNYATPVVLHEGLIYVRSNRQYATVGLEDKLIADDNSGPTYQDQLASNEKIVEDYIEKEIAEILWAKMGFLKPREQFCMLAYTGKYGRPITQSEIAKCFDMDQSMISKIIKKCKLALIQMLEDPKYISSGRYRAVSKNGRIPNTSVTADYHLLTKDEFWDMANSYGINENQNA